MGASWLGLKLTRQRVGTGPETGRGPGDNHVAPAASASWGPCAWGTGSSPRPAHGPTASSPPPPDQHPWDLPRTAQVLGGES